MKSFDPTTLNAWMEDRVEAFVDAELPLEEQAAFAYRVSEEEEWEAEMRLAEQIQQGLRTLPQPLCPPDVTHAVLTQARKQARASYIQHLQERITAIWFELWQPALAMSLLVGLVVSAALFGKPNTVPEPIDPEVAAALAEVKWTLGYLSGVSKDAGLSIREEVLKEHVMPSMEYALGSFGTDKEQPK